jgi:hypothetical protein
MTAVQQVFSELLALHPQLFNINSVEGREFVNHFHNFLEVEKEQIKDAWLNSLTKGDFNSADEYYNQTYKSEQQYKK